MKHALEFMFYHDHRQTREHWPKDDPVFDARRVVSFMVFMFLFAFIFMFWRISGFDAIGWFAQFWPETHHVGKGMRALDGLPIVVSIGIFVWARSYYSGTKVERILKRFESMTDEEYKNWSKVGVFLRFSGAACLFMVGLKYDLANAVLIVCFLWAEWKLYKRFYCQQVTAKGPEM